MEAQKVTVTITIEALSIDTLSALLMEVKQRVDDEFENGKLVASDGDTIEWKVERKDVEF